MNANRITQLQAAMREQNIDAMALVPGPNMLYVSQIHSHLSERPIVLIVPANGDPGMIVPILEAPKAKAAGIKEKLTFAWGDGEGYMGAFQQACHTMQLGGKSLAVEKLYMRMLEWDMLEEFATGVQKEYADPILNKMRLVKDGDELARMRQAVEVAENAMHAVLPNIKVGQTEKEIAAMLTLALMDAGADGVSFGPIVSSGPNAASPHAVPTDRPIEAGELMIIDWGAMVDDYPSDITRTFAVGAISDELRQIYDTVAAANAAGVRVVSPQSTCSHVDEASRGVIEAAGYGEYFIHRTGHGLGLEVHEEPSMMSGNHQLLVEGMTFTVEPGIYIAGKGGARVEDDVVVTADGHQSLTSFPRELITVG